MTVEAINSTMNSTTTKGAAREKDKILGYIGGAEPAEQMNIVLIPKQNVEFSDPPRPKTKKAQEKKRAKTIKLIRNEGFKILTDPDDDEQMLLYVGKGRAIGIFRSVYEIHHYVQKGYPIADIERHEAEFEFLEDASDPAVH